jgi:recombination protein RecR
MAESAPHSESLEQLIDALRRLPAIGLKSAERLAYHLLHAPEPEVMRLAEAIRNVKKNALYCGVCGNLTDQDPCRICRDPRRDRSRICVVELPRDVTQLEKTGSYDGVYHVLMGRVAPLDGVEGEHLRIRNLVDRVRAGGIREVILATNPNVDGDHTALLVRQALTDADVNGTDVTALARGVPVGTELEFVDGAILGHALRGRRKIDL